MQPATQRDFLRVASQRLDGAELILKSSKLTLEALYLGDYAIECSLKALILEKPPIMPRIEMLYRLTLGAVNHRADVLVGWLNLWVEGQIT